MEIRQLEYFRAIVDAGTISGAARELHMTQPPLSYQMKMLEEELQVPLFIRGMKHITLTEAGLVCDIYLACEDARTAITMAERGMGITILPTSMLELSDKLKACEVCGADFTTEILLA